MNRILIDANIYSHALRGAGDVVEVLRKMHVIAICTISIGELLSGFKGGGQEKKNREELAIFLDSPRVRILSIDDETAEFYAELLHILKKAGRPIPTNDLWIGAAAMQHGFKLFSKDRHFQNIPGLLCLS